MILLFYSSSHMAFTAQVLDSVSKMVDFQAVPHFFPHSSTAPWSGVCSQSCWPRIFNVFLFGSLDDLIVSKLGLWVVTLKLAPNAAWYYFGCLLSLALSLSLTHTHAFYIFISMCFHFLQRRRQTCFFWNVLPMQGRLSGGNLKECLQTWHGELMAGAWTNALAPHLATSAGWESGRGCRRRGPIWLMSQIIAELYCSVAVWPRNCGTRSGKITDVDKRSRRINRVKQGFMRDGYCQKVILILI